MTDVVKPATDVVFLNMGNKLDLNNSLYPYAQSNLDSLPPLRHPSTCSQMHVELYTYGPLETPPPHTDTFSCTSPGSHKPTFTQQDSLSDPAAHVQAVSCTLRHTLALVHTHSDTLRHTHTGTDPLAQMHTCADTPRRAQSLAQTHSRGLRHTFVQQMRSARCHCSVTALSC